MAKEKRKNIEPRRARRKTRESPKGDRRRANNE
jgi:hypothetical protein